MCESGASTSPRASSTSATRPANRSTRGGARGAILFKDLRVLRFLLSFVHVDVACCIAFGSIHEALLDILKLDVVPMHMKFPCVV